MFRVRARKLQISPFPTRKIKPGARKHCVSACVSKSLRHRPITRPFDRRSAAFLAFRRRQSLRLCWCPCFRKEMEGATQMLMTGKKPSRSRRLNHSRPRPLQPVRSKPLSGERPAVLGRCFGCLGLRPGGRLQNLRYARAGGTVPSVERR